MRRRRRRIDEPENLDRWLLTYADLITLLLAFFVVMYSMSQVDAKRFGKVTEALNGILKGGEIAIKMNPDNKKTGHGLLKLGNLRMIQQKIEEKFKKMGKTEEVQTEITERGLVVHIMESALFRKGSASFGGRTVDVLDLVGKMIAPLPNHIRVEGHTDDSPIKTSTYPSNWELSSARATECVRYFIENHNLQPDRVSALGYGKYRPVKENNSIENRASNRRVDVVMLTMELTLKEPTSQLYWLNDSGQNIPDSAEIVSR